MREEEPITPIRRSDHGYQTFDESDAFIINSPESTSSSPQSVFDVVGKVIINKVRHVSSSRNWDQQLVPKGKVEFEGNNILKSVSYSVCRFPLLFFKKHFIQF